MATLIRLTSGPEIDGKITVNAEFSDLSSTARIDLLADWLGVLNELYCCEYQAVYGGEYTPHELCLAAIKYQQRKS